RLVRDQQRIAVGEDAEGGREAFFDRGERVFDAIPICVGRAVHVPLERGEDKWRALGVRRAPGVSLGIRTLLIPRCPWLGFTPRLTSGARLHAHEPDRGWHDRRGEFEPLAGETGQRR